MEFSQIHRNFAHELNNQDALTDPKKYLGPNYNEVLRFWHYLDTLNNYQWKIVIGRYRALPYDAYDAARNAARDAADVVVGKYARYSAFWAPLLGYADYAREATLELIAMHKLESLTFLSLFDGFNVSSSSDCDPAKLDAGSMSIT